MNDDLISRQAAIEALRTCYDTHTLYDENNGDDYILYDEAVGEIESLPSIQPKTGQWVKYPDCYGCFKCSECGMLSLNRLRYCYGCGAKMEERWSK